MLWILIAVIALQQNLLLQEIFDARQASALKIDVARGDVVLTTDAEVKEVRVEVSGTADDWESLDRVYRELDFDVVQEGDRIRLTTRKREASWRFWEWLRTREVSFEIHVTLPEHYAVDVRTAGGDIEGGVHRQSTHFRTSGGDISYAFIEAPETIRLETAGGDIEGGTLRAPEIVVRTSGGDIQIERIEGEQLSVSTLGGDIAIGAWSGEGRVRTSGGDIVVRSVEGILNATTSGGDIEVYLYKPVEVNLRTAGGDIDIWAPEDVKAFVDFKGGRVRIARVFSFSGDITRRRASGTLNGGEDVVLVARTAGGRVTLRPLVRE